MNSSSRRAYDHTVRSNMAWGARYGLSMAALYSLVALVMLVTREDSFPEAATAALQAIGVYLLGGVTAGAIVGLFRPLARRSYGAVLIGVPAAAAAFGAALVLAYGVPWHWREAVWLLLGTGSVVIGPLFGFLAWRHSRRTSAVDHE